MAQVANETLAKNLTPGELAEALTIAINAGRAAMVHGDPGIGKSQIAEQVADAIFANVYADEGYGYENGQAYKHLLRTGKVKKADEKIILSPGAPRPWFKDTRAALLDNVDLRGLPAVVNGQAKWMIPEFLPSDPRGGVWLLDEINRGQEMTQNGLFSAIIPPYTLGEWHKPQAWGTVACVNDKDVGARKMSSALLARFLHLDLGGEVSDKWLDDVCKIAAKRDWHPMVFAFLRSFPHLLHKYDPKARVSPNPRGWEFVSDIMKLDPPLNLMKALVAGQVGDAVAIEFVAFAAMYRKLPNLDNVISNPGTADIPNGAGSASVLYAISAALARRATPRNFGQIITYFDRVANEAKKPEYSVACVTDAVRRTSDLQHEPCYTKWAHQYHEVIL